ncbi:hypothetical protein QAD02_015122, partial [Eretmocerus hayati]
MSLRKRVMYTFTLVNICVFIAESMCSSLVRSREVAEEKFPHTTSKPGKENWSKIAQETSFLISFSQELPDLSYEIEHSESNSDRNTPLELKLEESKIEINSGEQKIKYETTLSSPIGIGQEDFSDHDPSYIRSSHYPESFGVLLESDPKIQGTNVDNKPSEEKKIYDGQEGLQWDPEADFFSHRSDENEVIEKKLSDLKESHSDVGREKRNVDHDESVYDDSSLDLFANDEEDSKKKNVKSTPESADKSAVEKKDRKKPSTNVQVVQPKKPQKGVNFDEVDPFLDWDSGEKIDSTVKSKSDGKGNNEESDEYMVSFLSG